MESAGHTRPVLLSEGQYYDSGGPAGHMVTRIPVLCGQAFRSLLGAIHRFYHDEGWNATWHAKLFSTMIVSLTCNLFSR